LDGSDQDDGSSQDDLTQYDMVYQSDYIEHTLDPKFPTVVLPSLALTNTQQEGDGYDTHLLLRMFDYDVGASADFIGACHFSVRELALALDDRNKDKEAHKRPLWNAAKAAAQAGNSNNSKKAYKGSGILTFRSVDVFSRLEVVDAQADLSLGRLRQTYAERPAKNKFSQPGPSKREAFLCYMLHGQSLRKAESSLNLLAQIGGSTSDLGVSPRKGRRHKKSNSSSNFGGLHAVGGGSATTIDEADEGAAGAADGGGAAGGGSGMGEGNLRRPPNGSLERAGTFTAAGEMSSPRDRQQQQRHGRNKGSNSSNGGGGAHGGGSRPFADRPLGERVDEGDGEGEENDENDDDSDESDDDDDDDEDGSASAPLAPMRSATFTFLAAREREASYQLVFRGAQLPKPSSVGFFAGGPECILEVLADRKLRGEWTTVHKGDAAQPASTAPTFPPLLLKAKAFLPSSSTAASSSSASTSSSNKTSPAATPKIGAVAGGAATGGGEDAPTCMLRVWHVPKGGGGGASSSPLQQLLGEAITSFASLRTPGMQLPLLDPATAGLFAGSITVDSAKLINAALVQEKSKKKKKKKDKKKKK
jgi:hypothetical protein